MSASRLLGVAAVDSSAVLQLLDSSRSESMARQAHALIVRRGMDGFFFLRTALVRLYSRSGRPRDAQKVFDETPEKNAVAWTTIVSASVRNGDPAAALRLFRRMLAAGVAADEVSLTSALSACSDAGGLRDGAAIHAYSIRLTQPNQKKKKKKKKKESSSEDLILKNALIDMYVKCGEVQKARYLFDLGPHRDVTTWTSMIFGYAINGQANDALALFAEMKLQRQRHGGAAPNRVTFLGVLMACSHAGRVEEALRHLLSMRSEHRLEPQISHYGCVLDALCRAGMLQAALEFADAMTIPPNAVIWRTLLGACAKNGEIGAADQARRRLLVLEPEHAGDDVAMANAYAAAGMWEEKEEVRKRGAGRRRDPGRSTVEIDGRLYEFVAGDRSHRRKSDILAMLRGIAEISSASGFLL